MLITHDHSQLSMFRLKSVARNNFTTKFTGIEEKVADYALLYFLLQRLDKTEDPAKERVS